MVGELTIGAMAITTGVAALKSFLKLFGNCLDQELTEGTNPTGCYKESHSSDNTPVNITVSEADAEAAGQTVLSYDGNYLHGEDNRVGSYWPTGSYVDSCLLEADKEVTR